MVDVLAMPVLIGRKTAQERFPGAINTLTCEAMMRDGKALQMGTSHELGQNFAKVFDIQSTSTTAAPSSMCWTTSWGVSTRMIGGLIMAHGDDAGLRVPPRLAPIQVVVLLIRDEEGAGEAAARLADELTPPASRCHAGRPRPTCPSGGGPTDWELKGVPVRIEVGPRDLGDRRGHACRAATPARKTQVPVARGRRAGAAAARHDPGRHAGRGDGSRPRAHRRRRVHRRGDEAAQTGSPGCPGPRSGPKAKTGPGRDGITVRCLRREDGSLPLDDAEPGLFATVGRAY